MGIYKIFTQVMYSCNIESLYTSMPTEIGLEAIEYWSMRKRNLMTQCFAKEFILELIEFILKNDNLTFDSKIFNRSLQQPWAQNVLSHMHVSTLVIKNKLNCLPKSYQNTSPMKSAY